MGNHGEFNSLALDLAREIVAELVIRNIKCPEMSYEKSLEAAKDMVPCFNAAEWDAGWRGAQKRLELGQPTLMFINLSAGGFSKNLKYKVPENLCDMVHQSIAALKMPTVAPRWILISYISSRPQVV